MYKFILICLLFMTGCQQEKINNPQIIWLQNESLKIGIWPEVGGRMVFAALQNHPNVLNSNYWKNQHDIKPEINANGEYKSYNGHSVWLSPQSEWWSRQDIDLKKKEEKSIWPPDPYLIFDKYSVISNSPNEVILLSPESEFTGVQLKKTYQIDGNKIHIKAEIRNIRDTATQWGLWMNTRMHGLDYGLVSVEDESKIRLQKGNPKTSVKSTISEGYFHFIPHEVDNNVQKSSKAFITPKEPVIYGVGHDQLLKISFPAYAPSEIHPDQAPVEFYNCLSTDMNSEILELEVHYPYLQISPNEHIEAEESMELFPYNKSLKVSEIIDFIEKL